MSFKVLSNTCMFLEDITFKENILLNNVLYQARYYFPQHILSLDIYSLYDIYVQQYEYVHQYHIDVTILFDINIL